jgi:hypothetical protein
LAASGPSAALRRRAPPRLRCAPTGIHRQSTSAQHKSLINDLLFIAHSPLGRLFSRMP